MLPKGKHARLPGVTKRQLSQSSRMCNIFLKSVRPPRGSSGTTANFEVYQWYPKTGTTIHSVLKTSVGEEIGGEQVTELYDVAKEKYDDKATVEFDTQNYLVDAIPVPTIRLDEHPDLNLSKKTRGVLPIDAEAIIVDNFGNLKKSLPPAASANYETTKRNFDRERKALEWVKTATEARTAGPADGFGPAGEPGFVGMVPGAFGPEAEMLGPPKKGKKNRRKKNPIRVPNWTVTLASNNTKRAELPNASALFFCDSYR